jgi:hypothetical protein
MVPGSEFVLFFRPFSLLLLLLLLFPLHHHGY